MNAALIDKIARAVLYEGYILYPYRPSVKNRQRWTFGGLFPSGAVGEPSTMQAQCLIIGDDNTTIDVTARFLHLTARTVGRLPDLAPLESIEVGGKRYQTWQEAVEREVAVASQDVRDLIALPHTHSFEYTGRHEQETLDATAALIREQQSVRGTIEVSTERLAPRVYRVTVIVRNETAPSESTSRDEMLMRSLASTHAVLGVRRGEFASLTDPPMELRAFASSCKNVGCWPVLVGEAGVRDTILASPIILPDYPQIAPESPGDLFDGTEIDEILTLRIMTLTDDEKRAAAAVDENARALLERTASLGQEQLMGLHGTMRGVRPIEAPSWDPLDDRRQLEKTLSAGIELKPGDRVRLWPQGRADIMDIALEGRFATVDAIEQDYENRIHVAVTIDDDPGADFGRGGKTIGHRFFFRPEEVEPVSGDQPRSNR